MWTEGERGGYRKPEGVSKVMGKLLDLSFVFPVYFNCFCFQTLASKLDIWLLSFKYIYLWHFLDSNVCD